MYEFEHLPEMGSPSIVQCLSEYCNSKQTQAPSDDPAQLAEIWHRLATRSEMEAVWHFIAQFDNDNYFPLVANGDLFGNINSRLRAYHAAPKLSPTYYGDEMTEIARMVAALCASLKKFSAADLSYYNPLVNDKHALRTYFISIVSDYFLAMYHDYAPSRLAIFRSVALTRTLRPT